MLTEAEKEEERKKELFHHTSFGTASNCGSAPTLSYSHSRLHSHSHSCASSGKQTDQADEPAAQHFPSSRLGAVLLFLWGLGRIHLFEELAVALAGLRDQRKLSRHRPPLVSFLRLLHLKELRGRGKEERTEQERKRKGTGRREEKRVKVTDKKE